MSLTLGGQALVLPTTEVLDWISEQEFIPPWWPLHTEFGLSALARTQGIMPNWQDMIGKYVHLPLYASRWSFGLFLCSTNQFYGNASNQGILYQAYGAKLDQQNALPLYMASEGSVAAGAGDYMSTKVYLAHYAPLAGIVGGNFNGLWLLLVVDQRYYWQKEGVSQTWHANPINNPTSQTWDNLLKSLVSSLGITMQYDTIGSSSDYLYPSNNYNNLNNQSAGKVLDSICANLGLRFVANLDGTFAAVTTAEAQTQLQKIQSNVIWSVRRGGYDPETWGPSRILPAQCLVRYPVRVCDVTNGFPAQPQYYYSTVDLSAVGVNVTGFIAGTYLVIEDCCALMPNVNSVTPYNQTELDKLANQIFQDYVDWRQIPFFDITYNGIVAYTPTGCEDMIIWTYRESNNKINCSTRAVAPPIATTETIVMNHQDGYNLLNNCADNVQALNVSGGPISNGTPGVLVIKDIYCLPSGASSGTYIGMAQVAIENDRLAEYWLGWSHYH